jgi:hypothetical protein
MRESREQTQTNKQAHHLDFRSAVFCEPSVAASNKSVLGPLILFVAD